MSDPVDTALMAELQLELATLKRALHQAEEDANRLRGLWPRAELQHLQLALAEKTAAHAWAAEHYAALRRSTIANLPRSIFVLARQLGPIVRQLRWLARFTRGLPRRMALLRQHRADHADIASSPLFDAAWYRVAAMGGDPAGDPVAHYLWLGHAAGHDPHPLFDGAWYGAAHPALGLANPFANYLRRGMAANEDPHPLFDTAYYLVQAPEAGGRALLHYEAGHGSRSPVPLFDPSDYPEGLAHWVHTGAAAGRDPHALFATDWYRRTHLRDQSGLNPLAHWVREGAAAGLPPNPFGLTPETPVQLAEPGSRPTASVIVWPGQSAMDTTRSLISVLQGARGLAVEAILVGGNTKPQAVGWVQGLRAAPDLAAAIMAAKGRYLVFLGAGTVGHQGWLAALLDTAERDSLTGLIGAKLLAADGALHSVGVAINADGHMRNDGAGEDPALPSHAFARPTDAVYPAVMLVRREAWDAVGGLDDDCATDIFGAASLAFALRARGWRVIVQPASIATVLHPLDESGHRERFFARWGEALSNRVPAGAILVLTDAVPDPDTPAGRALNQLRRDGVRAVLHPLDPEPPSAAVALWARGGVEVIHSFVVFDDWLAQCGGCLDAVWSFRAAVDVPAEALLRHTGAALLQWQPGTSPPGWCDGEPPS